MSTDDENDDLPPMGGALPVPSRRAQRSRSGGAATVRNSPIEVGRTTGAARGGDSRLHAGRARRTIGQLLRRAADEVAGPGPALVPSAAPTGPRTRAQARDGQEVQQRPRRQQWQRQHQHQQRPHQRQQQQPHRRQQQRGSPAGAALATGSVVGSGGRRTTRSVSGAAGGPASSVAVDGTASVGVARGGQPERRRAQRPAGAVADEGVSGGSPRAGERAGRRPGRGARAREAQRRTRSVNDMAREDEVARDVDGPDHSGGLDGGTLGSPPVPEGLAGLLSSPVRSVGGGLLDWGASGASEELGAVFGSVGLELEESAVSLGLALDPTPDDAPAVDEPARVDAGSPAGSAASERAVERSGGPRQVRSLPSGVGCAAGAVGGTASSSRSTRSTASRGRQRSRMADGDGEAGAAAAGAARTDVGTTMRVTRSVSRAAGRQQTRVPGDAGEAVGVPGGTSGAGGRAGGRPRRARSVESLFRGGVVGGVIDAHVEAVASDPQAVSCPDTGGGGLDSPPLPSGLVGLLGVESPAVSLGLTFDPTPGAAPGERERAEVAVNSLVDGGAEERAVERLSGPFGALSSSAVAVPARGLSSWIGPLFTPVDAQWCGHDMTEMPPSGVVDREGSPATYSWLFCPMILDAVGWPEAFPSLPRTARWTQLANALGQALAEAGITLDIVGGYVLEGGPAPFHMTAERQEQIIGMAGEAGQLVQAFGRRLRFIYASGPRVATVTEYQPNVRGRGRHVIQWDDTVGDFTNFDISNSRVPIEFLSADGTQVLWRHRRAEDMRAEGSRQRLADPGGPGRRAGDVPQAARALAVEACETPVVESEAAVEVSGTPGGEFALLDASALEALLRGEAEGAGASFRHESVLSRDLTADEVDGVGQHLRPPEVVRLHEGRWHLAMMVDEDEFDLGDGLVQGATVSMTLRAAWDAMREARAQLGDDIHGPLPERDVVVEELALAPSGLSASEAATALTAFQVQEPEELGDECYICGQDWEPGQGAAGAVAAFLDGLWVWCPQFLSLLLRGVREGGELRSMTVTRLRHHEPDDYALTDLSAFGCAACPRCEVAYASGAPLTSHYSTCSSVVEAGEGAGGEAGPGVASRVGGTPGASRGRRQGAEVPADPVVPDASWEWLRGLDLAEVFACPLTTARHVPKRARNQFAEAMRWVMRSLGSGDEDFWRLLGLAPRLLLGSIPEARKKSLPAEVVRERVRRFLAGDWEELYRVSVPSAPAWPGRASEERAFADVVSLVKEGQLSKAVRRLDPGALAPLVEETLEALRDLHPAGDGLPGRVQAAPLELEEAAVEAECRRLPVASGPGCSQLRFEHIGVIFGGGDGLPAIKHACEQFVGDRVPAGVLPWIMGARLVALLKPGGGVRPIACGESLRRLAGKVVCRQMRTRWATYFSPPPREGAASSAAQLGVGVPGGAEVCVHTVQALLGADPSWCDLALDCKNAFNTVKRSVIYKEVSDNFPELLGMAESSFRHRARLGWQGADGRFRWVESAEGAQQGDPLGPFFTAVALQPALQATLDEHPDVFIMAYLDDIHIIGPPDKARAAYGTIVPLLRAAGLELNVSKSTVYSPAGACPEFADVVDGGGAPMPGSVTPLDGVKVLGIPVGSDRWVADKCVEMAFAAGAVLPKLARLDDPQVQLLLLRFCAHPRFMHLVRGVPPHLLVRGALAHDNGIQECLQEVAGSPYPLGEEAVALSQLPTRWGGLGLSSAQRLAPAGWLGSWAQVWGRMVVLFPAVRDMLPHLGAPEDSEVGEHPLAAGMVAAMGDVRGARARVVEALGAGHPVPESLKVPEEAPVWGGFGSSQPTRQKELTNYQHGSDWLRLFEGANTSVRARLLSLSRDGATAHLNALPHDGGFRMRPTAAVIALCLQLGASIPLVREVSAVGTGSCACGEVVDDFGYHYLACNRRGMFTYRHDAVQDVLYEMLRKVFDPASVKRTHVYHRSYSPHWRPDITVLNFDGRGRHLVIDVAIGFPCAQTHVDGAARVPLHTAAALERQKAYTYGDISPHRLVAFAMEAFGGLGEQAKQLLRDCARRRQDRLGPEMASATWSTPTFESYWGQRIMVALHSAQAFGLHGRALEDYPQ
ncbi:hypothetical protein CYMTET_16023 [Cymbomonas tetramitiformis]|uniref:Reverse transcriptase domain-containing protein n=1 Tax=Cymbomonas tetramitiformis TaxID=36881 RepID=A0AAE0GD13_9CHLO|nr:hypothetical protein CYMTET_16023 [Cymbomonas tetramitiformis]